MKIDNTYLGFTNKFSPMQKTRIENVLDNVKRYDGVIKTNKQFIYDELLNGCIPEINENYVTYNRRTGENTKPKTVYIIKSKDNSFWTVEKTLHDFAVYIIENNFLDEVKVNTFITAEQDKIENEKRLKEEQETKEKEERERKEKEKVDFENWLNIETLNYNDEVKLNLLKEIFLGELGQFGGNSIKLLVLIDNFDNPMCKDAIKSWLGYYNTTSLKVFFHITGIRLGTTDKEIQVRLDNITSKDFTGMIPYKKRAEQKEKEEVEQVIFFKRMRNNEFEECMGEHIKKYGLDLFVSVNRTTGYYTITEGKTGCGVGQGNSKKEAFEQFNNYINRVGIEALNKNIQETIDRNGISPKYREKVAV